jgi:hypothetical protein
MGRNSTLDLVIALATAWYALRLLRPQALPVATLWALPALMVAVCAWQSHLFTGAAPGPLALAGLGGALAGLAVGHLTFRSADERTGRVLVQGTPLSVLLWPGAIVPALAARYALGGGAEAAPASLLDVGLLVFLVGNASAQRAYLGWRYSRSTRRGAGGRGRAGG